MSSVLQYLDENNSPETSQGRGDRLNEAARKHNELVNRYLNNPGRAREYIKRAINRCFGNEQLAKVVMFFSEEYRIALEASRSKNTISPPSTPPQSATYGRGNPCDFL